jgi:uncharacterized protein YceK
MKKKIVILAAVAMLCACASHRDSSNTKWKETPYASVKQDGKGKKEKKSKKKKSQLLVCGARHIINLSGCSTVTVFFHPSFL